MWGLWFALSGCGVTLENDESRWPTSQWDTAVKVCTTTVVLTAPTGDDVNRHRDIAIDLPPDRHTEAKQIELYVDRFAPVSQSWKPVPGRVELLDGAFLRVQFVPDAPLHPLTEHRVVASSPACPNLVEYTFTTNDIGVTVLDPEEAVGQPFVGNAANASLTLPGRATSYLEPTGAVRFVIEALDESNGVITMGVRRQPLDIYKDVEAPVPLEGSWNNPTFVLTGSQFPMHLAGGVPVELRDVVFQGDLSPDRKQLAGLLVRGTLDMRALSSNYDKAELCAQMSATGQCEDCEDGQPFCTLAEFRDWTATRLAPY